MSCFRDISFFLTFVFAAIGLYQTFFNGKGYLEKSLFVSGVAVLFIVKWKLISKDFWVWDRPVKLRHIQEVYRMSEPGSPLNSCLRNYLEINLKRTGKYELHDNIRINAIRAKLQKNINTISTVTNGIILQESLVGLEKKCGKR